MTRACQQMALGLWMVLGFAAGTGDGAEDPRLVAPTEPLSPAEQLKKFRLPPGFAIELVASEPAIYKPMNLAFDAQGRLFVSNSIEYPFPAKQGTTPRDRITMLVDRDGDGTFERSTTFAHGLDIPIGVASVGDAVLGHGIPNVLRFVDRDGDGIADSRDILLSSIGFRDTHGMTSAFTWWIDGWIHACHGFSNDSTIKGPDGRSITMNSGNTYRFRPDGTGIEQFTWGQVNPFGLAFDPLGNLYSADCHTLPIHQLLRGAYYPSFGKPHDGLGFGPTILEHLHGSTGIAGLVYYADTQFPGPYQGSMFVGNPVTGRINHDQLEVHGSSDRAIERPDFVTCDDPWFRPVDLKLGPDGALYVADFYNKIIGHYEVPLTHPGRDRDRGRIWRIVYRGTGEVPAPPPRTIPNLEAMSASNLFDQLDHPGLTVRVWATHQLVERIGAPAIGPARQLLTGPSQPIERVHALWIVERLVGLDDAEIDRLASDTDRAVRVHLGKLLSNRAGLGKVGERERKLLRGMLADPDAYVRRAAADALGRAPSDENVGPLLALWASTPGDDTHLIHVTRMAVRDQLLASPDLAKLVERFASEPANLDRLADVALGARIPAAARFEFQYLSTHPATDRRLEERIHFVARHGDDAVQPELLAFALSLEKEEGDRQRAVLRGMRQGRSERGAPIAPELVAWGERLARNWLASDDAGRRRAGLDLVREQSLGAIADDVARLTIDQHPEELRIAAIDALLAVAPERVVSVVPDLVGDKTPAIRLKGAEALASVRTSTARNESARLLRRVPANLALVLARGLAANREGCDILLSSVQAGGTSPRVLLDPVVMARLRDAEVPIERTAPLTKDLPPEDERLAQLMMSRKEGFAGAQPVADRGKEIFAKNCGICHRLAGTGTKIGPELDGVALRGIDRILEDVFEPHRNVDQAFRGSVLSLADGRLLAGLVLREEGNVVVLADAQGKEVRIEKGDIEDRKRTVLSPMPTDVAEKLPESDFFDLLAFLLTQRQAPAADAGASKGN